MDVIEAALKEGRILLSEHESKEVLHACGIPVTREKEVYNEHGFRQAVAEIGYPLVIKSGGPEISHKTEQGLVHLNIRNEQEAMAIFNEMTKKTKAILVQEMIKGDRELMAGFMRDSQFGPCVMFGLGGIFTEILNDVAFRVAPIEKSEALDMIGGMKARKILEAFRGMPAVDMDRLVDIVIRLGAIGLEHVHIKEIDVNPIIISGSSPVAVDALIVLNGNG